MSARVTKEQAIKLKQLGYDVPLREYWLNHNIQGFLEDESRYKYNHNNPNSFHYSRPTLNDVADWLREMKEVHVCVSINCNNDGIFYNAAIAYIENDTFIRYSAQDAEFELLNKMGICTPVIYTTHTEALSASIDAAIDKLLNTEK